MLPGNHSRAIGTFQLTSPQSFEAKIIFDGPVSGVAAGRKPVSSTPPARCVSRASACSSSLHSGMPMASMLRCTASARVWLARTGQTALLTSTVTSVLVIIAAPSAMRVA